ncbi:MAG: tyrosine-type recombinase/integrase [Clostridiales bacterium]|jgi:integrase|nr:tyrosine-type recombinase/integrase [Clostridiales bacterium]
MNDKKIRQLSEEFILYKTVMGYMYDTPKFYLKRYVDYVETVGPEAIFPEKSFTTRYLDSLTNAPGSLYGTVCVLREFSRYLFKHGYEKVYIIPPKSASLPTAEPPYFFTQKEINKFFEKLDGIQKNPSFKGRELVVPAIFRLLYCCGLRCKEARTLECCNVHMDELYIDVLLSKGHKSRRIFISEQLVEYMHNYDSRIRMMFPKRKYFFPHGDGSYSGSMISQNFKRFWKEAYPDFVITTRPRAYDFRHHFAWANLNRWASEGIDVNVMVAYLMRYMGHQSISETLYYFHFVPEFFPTFQGMTRQLEDVLPEVPYED